MMRWKAILPISVLLTAWAVFMFVFLDPLAKRILEKTGTKINGAKVDVSSIHISLRNAWVEINGLQITDKDDPWKNIVELNSIRFNFDWEPLFSKKIIIDEMAAEGLRWGTARKTSGEVRIEKSTTPSFVSKVAQKIPTPQLDTSQLEKIKNTNFEELIKPENLKSLKIVNETQTDVENLKATYEKKIENLKIQETIDQVKKSAEKIQNLKVQTIQDIPQAKAAIDELNASQSLVKAKIQEVESIQSGLKKDFSEVQAKLKSIEKLKSLDTADIMKELHLPDFSSKGLARSFFGPLWVQRLEKTLYYIQLARKYMPAQKDKEEKVKLPPAKRRKGINVSFPDHRTWPKFLVKKISVSGSSAQSSTQSGAIDFSGQVLGITSDPSLYGQPAKIDLKGSQIGSPLAASVSVVLDHTGDIAKDELLMTVKGLEVAQMIHHAENSKIQIQAGQAQADFQLNYIHLDLSARLNLQAKNLKTKNLQQGLSQTESIFYSVLENIPNLEVNADARGTEDHLDFSVDTNLDEIFSSKLKSLVGDQLSQVQLRIEKKVNELLSEKMKGVEGLAGNQQKIISDLFAQKTSILKGENNQLQSASSQLEKQMKQATGSQIQKALPDALKNIFR